jgi:hypothetical protein
VHGMHSQVHGVGSQVHGVHSEGTYPDWGNSEQGRGMPSSWQATTQNSEFQDSLNAFRVNQGSHGDNVDSIQDMNINLALNGRNMYH